MRCALTIAAALIASTGTMAAPTEFPVALRGVWAETPITCELVRNRSIGPAPSPSWIIIGREAVEGTTSATFKASRGLRAAVARYIDAPDIAIIFELKPSGFLEETVEGARASMSYVRCP